MSVWEGEVRTEERKQKEQAEFSVMQLKPRSFHCS